MRERNIKNLERAVDRAQRTTDECSQRLVSARSALDRAKQELEEALAHADIEAALDAGDADQLERAHQSLKKTRSKST